MQKILPALGLKRRSRPGALPGTIATDPASPKPVMRLIAYGPDEFVEKPVEDLAEVKALRGRYPVLWLNVDGLGDASVIRAVGEVFGIHVLALEDVVNVHQRPKVEGYSDHLFIVTRMTAGTGDALRTEQISIFLGEGYIVTFQEAEGDCLDPLRERLRRGMGRVRPSGADYLAYSILDSVIDGYFPLIERASDTMAELESDVAEGPTEVDLSDIHRVRRDLLALRRSIWPQREMLASLQRGDFALVRPETRLYLRDCYDHVIQLMDLMETMRELSSDLLGIHMSAVSNRLNEVTKLLTIIATIFIPLGFIASVFGMNFAPESSPWNMPELNWRYGYPAALALMAAVAGGLVYFFRRKRWL